MFDRLKWKRIGYIEGMIVSEDYTLKEKAILFIREPFLWFNTRKVKRIGDQQLIRYMGVKSEHYRLYCMNIEDWLLGGKIDYVSDDGMNKPAEVIRLVKK